MTNEKSILGRLEALETQNRKLRGIFAVLLVAAASVVLMGQATGNRTVEANEFVLRDTSGKVRARLSVRDCPGCATSLVFQDDSGMTRLMLSEASVVKGPLGGGSSAGLTLFDDKGKDRVRLYADTELGARLEFTGADGNTRVSVQESSLLLLAPDFLSGNNYGSVDISAKVGGRSSIWVSGDNPAIRIKDREGFETIIGSTSFENTRTGESNQTSAASVILFGKDGKGIIWKAP